MKTKTILLFISCFLLNFVNGQAQYWPTNGWERSNPEKQGLNQTVLSSFVDSLNDDGSVIIIKNGFIISEHYSDKYPEDCYHNMHSFTKSITSTLIGIAISEGYIKSIDDLLIDYFPEIDKKDSLKKQITIKHLLTMSSGLAWLDKIDLDSLYNLKSDWVSRILSKKMKSKPGSVFNYNSGGSFLLSAIIQKQTKMLTSEYAKDKLFRPLGIDSVNWTRKSPQGITTGGWGSYFKLRDIAKIGYLYLQHGKWENRQIVPENWVDEATRKQIDVNEEDDNYGLHWWIINEFLKPAFAARGWYGNHYGYVIVIPDDKLIIAIAGEVTYYKAKCLIRKFLE